jgi:3-oxosteroid 1-dehydrogenase
MEQVYDFVVVGSGGGSMCAALVMRAAGKSVLILEKTDKAGGTTSMSGGVMWIPNNRFMKQDGVDDSYEKAMTYLETLVDNELPGSTRARKNAYLTEAPRMVDFLVDQGIKLRRIKHYPDYYDDLPGGSEPGRTVIADLFNAAELGPWRERLRPGFRRMPAYLDEMVTMANMKTSWKAKLNIARMAVRTLKARLLGQHWTNCGEALQGRMLQAALKAGVDIRLDSPVSRLVTDDHGRVTGVIATIDGRETSVGARLGVLINVGGFARNQAMRDKYQGGANAQWTYAGPGDTGEMIEEAGRIGARLAQMDQILGSPITLNPGWQEQVIKTGIQSDMSKPHAIMVDRRGDRYQRETCSYMEFCKTMYERDKTVPTLPSWMICDSQFTKKYMLAGTMPGTAKPREWYDSGYLRKADTIEDLASLCDLPPAALRRTVDRFNGFVRNNRDEDFHRGDRAYDSFYADDAHRPSTTLGSIEVGPFYAVEVYPGDIGTFGGILTDEYARALREDGSVIEGLYATGNSTASVMGNVYPGAGATVGPTFAFGYVAAKHAAGTANSIGEAPAG